jgi:uncharacterized protein
MFLLEFVRDKTKHFDESHDINHAIAVYSNAIEIANIEFPNCDTKILRYASLLHDVCDHKYKHSISLDDLHAFIKSKLSKEQAQIVIDVIDNVSYSIEIKGKRCLSTHLSQKYLDIVSDADRLEAIGDIGIKRCIAYTRATNGKVPEDVVKHCREKLVKLYNDGYIKTVRGRELAAPRHQVIDAYISQNH